MRNKLRLPSLIAKLRFLIQVSRPIFWPVLPLVYALGLNASHAPLSVAAIIQIALLTFPMNLVGCGLNDIYDYESDRRSSRRRAIWGAVVHNEDRPLVYRASLAMMPLIVLGACFTRNWDNIAATVSLLLVAWLYSVPPMRLKERPPLDSLANGFGYFLLPFAMGFSLNANPRTMPLKYFFLALCVCGIHALATAADYDADRAAGHRTLAVKFGRRTAAGIAFATFSLTLLFADFQGTAVRVYIAVCAVATLVAAVFPHDRVIAGACVTVFVGFVFAAAFHLAGM
jgi:4-hydroxybenzoate polyprenyltransferase